MPAEPSRASAVNVSEIQPGLTEFKRMPSGRFEHRRGHEATETFVVSLAMLARKS
ncbi:hypothetical protein [Nocardia sp. NPDC050412]|uniref:hypothetical protein n=1 Tax=unclassified Nocardia TaxID=2637762 RepID=UPI0037B6B5FC